MDNNGNGGFKFTYSAKEQAELKKIREKYENREEDKMERVRRLDRGVIKKARTVSLILGIIGTLVMGCGMSLAMTELSDVLGLSASSAMLTGVIIGVIGIIIAGVAYPVYDLTVKRERKKIAPEIIRLTDELLLK